MDMNLKRAVSESVIGDIVRDKYKEYKVFKLPFTGEVTDIILKDLFPQHGDFYWVTVREDGEDFTGILSGNHVKAFGGLKVGDTHKFCMLSVIGRFEATFMYPVER